MVRMFGIFIIIGIAAVPIIYAEDAKLGRDDFVSTSISAVFDKLGEYTSGEKSIFIEKAPGTEYGTRYSEESIYGEGPAPSSKAGLDAALNDPV
jgi:hypothetical protein